MRKVIAKKRWSESNIFDTTYREDIFEYEIIKEYQRVILAKDSMGCIDFIDKTDVLEIIEE